MSANELSLLFRLRAQNQASPVLNQVRTDVNRFTTNTASQFNAMSQVTTRALGNVSTSLTTLAGRLPIIGNAVTTIGTLTAEVSNLSSEATALSAGLGSVGATSAALAGPVAAVTGALVVQVGAVVALNLGLFHLTKTTADYQGALYDLSQQTGLTVETLSALQILAVTTGGDIDSIAASAGVFQKNLEEASDANSQAAKTFKSLGIETDNTEEALRQTLAVLAKLPEGYRQTALALELFGRGGKQLLAILKETGGDLDGAIDKFRALGIVVSTEDAKAADEFNDQLAILQFQLRGLVAMIGKEAIPVITNAGKALQNVLKDNDTTLQALGATVKGTAYVLAVQFVSALTTVNTFLKTQEPILRAVVGLYERLAGATPQIAGVELQPTGPQVGGTVGGGAELFTKTAVKARKDAATARAAAMKEIADGARDDLELQRHLTEFVRLEFERRGADLEKYYDRQETLTDAHLATLQKQINQERAQNQQAFSNLEISRTEFEDRKRDLRAREVEAENRHSEAIRRIRLEKDRALVQQEVQLRERAAEIQNAIREGELRRLQVHLEKGSMFETEVIGRRLEFLKKAHEERIGIIKFEMDQESTSAARKVQLEQEKTVAEQRYTDEKKRLTKERIDLLIEEARAATPPINQGQPVPEPGGNVVSPEDLKKLGQLPTGGTFGNVFRDINLELKETLELSNSLASSITNGLSAAFSALAQGVGETVRAFILFGKAEGGFRKFATEVIASIAQMAIVQAVFELAQGLAMSALAWFTGNPKYAKSAAEHYLAAAVFGSIGGIAALAGRAIAPPQEVAGGAFQSGSGSGSGSTTRNEPVPVNIDRNSGNATAGPASVNLSVKVTRDPGSIVEVMVDDVRSNGTFRQLMLAEMGG